jgi:hypothetical protein
LAAPSFRYQLSTYAFSESELRGIQKEVIAARGLEGEPLLPMFAEQVGYVDIAEMSKRKIEGIGPLQPKQERTSWSVP